MNEEQSSSRVTIVCAWTGPALTLLFAIGLIPLARFFPPPSPGRSAASIADLYTDHLTAVRIGCVVMSIAMALIAPWGVTLAMTMRRTERGMPVLTAIQLVSVAVCTMCAVMLTMVWGTAAFRPGHLSPDTTRMLNDFAWFLFLFDWAPFTVWVATFGVAVLLDETGTCLYPRWVGYMSLWMAFLFVPAALIIFFKSGAFAFNGVIAMYVPTFMFFLWIMVTSSFMIRSERRAPARGRSAEIGETRRADGFASTV
jgi:hypothetical protein